MGKGKGDVDYWAAVVKPGTVLFEIGGVPEEAKPSSPSSAWLTRCPCKVKMIRRLPTT